MMNFRRVLLRDKARLEWDNHKEAFRASEPSSRFRLAQRASSAARAYPFASIFGTGMGQACSACGDDDVSFNTGGSRPNLPIPQTQLFEPGRRITVDDGIDEQTFARTAPTGFPSTTDIYQQLGEFFKAGDPNGPAGCIADAKHNHETTTPASRQQESSFFAVFRPTSYDAVRLMVFGNAVGKGLNVKGKSAKTGRLSGFVPFMQISEEGHKAKIARSPKDARIRIFFKTEWAFETAHNALVEFSPTRITRIKRNGSHGLEVPERTFWDVFVKSQPIAQEEGWETGRESEPAFMELNLHATRDGARMTDKVTKVIGRSISAPRAVVMQWDDSRPLNPATLLMAYEEDRVLPVVSDFDAFLVGSASCPYPPSD